MTLGIFALIATAFALLGFCIAYKTNFAVLQSPRMSLAMALICLAVVTLGVLAGIGVLVTVGLWAGSFFALAMAGGCIPNRGSI